MRSFAALFLAIAAPAAAADCDRDCLRGFITQYLNALVAHNPGSLPLAATVRFTEDTVAIPLGEGLWKNASRIRPYRQDIVDVRQGVAASQVVVEEGGSPVFLMLRLKVAERKISEIETMVVRSQKEGAIFEPNALERANPEMAVVPEPAQRASREEAIRLAEFYPAGLKKGSFIDVNAPFAPGAYRLENGRFTAGPGCTRAGCENIKTQKIMEHPGITHRVAAVDEELGIVLLRMNFGQTGSYGPGNALIVWEAFKVYAGQIHAVEAFMEIMPASAGSGWDPPPVAGMLNFIHAVESREKSIAFYRDVFGLETPAPPRPPNPAVPALVNAPGAQLQVAVFRIPGASFGLELTQFGGVDRMGGQGKPTDPGVAGLVLNVRDIAPIAANLKKSGAPILSRSSDRALVTRDPDGYLIEAVQTAPPAGAPAGNIIGASMALTVGDMESTATFYRDLLGLPLAGSMEFSGDTAMLDLLDVPRTAEYRLMSATIPGANARLTFAEFKGVFPARHSTCAFPTPDVRRSRFA